MMTWSECEDAFYSLVFLVFDTVIDDMGVAMVVPVGEASDVLFAVAATRMAAVAAARSSGASRVMETSSADCVRIVERWDIAGHKSG